MARLVAAAVLAAVCGGCGRPARTVKEYSFLSHLPEAVSRSESDKDSVGFERFVVDWEGRDAFFQHPNSRLEFKRVSIGPKATLKFGVGMDQGCWFLGGDGAHFELVCRIGHSEKTLFSKYIDPKNNEQDRRWHDVEIDLSRFEGRVGSFVFTTTGGPRRNTLFDRAGWSDPVLVSLENAPEKFPPRRGKNVLLITADTLRADHLGCTGSPYVRTPNLDRLAGQGILFENHFANANVTNPSHITILSSLYAKDHDVHDNTTPVSEEVTLLPEMLRARGFRTAAFTSVVHLNPPLSGLGQGFDDFSYSPLIERAAALTNRDVFSWLENHGQEPFFVWVHYFDPHAPYTPGGPYHALYDGRVRESLPEGDQAERFREREALVQNLKDEIALLSEDRAGRDVPEKWLQLAEDGEFMALLLKRHPPSLPGSARPSAEAFADWYKENLLLVRAGRPSSPSFRDWMSGFLSVVDNETADDPNWRAPWLRGVTDIAKPTALYAGEVSYLDEHLGRLFDKLKDRHLYDRTMIVFTADHGECLGEHDIFFNHRTLYEGTLHVPLIIKDPSWNRKRKRITHLTNHVDILPTILDLLSLPLPDKIRGKSLVPLVRGSGEGFDDRTIYAEHAHRLANSLRTPRFKYIKETKTRHLFAFFVGRPAFVKGRRFLFDLSRDPGERLDLTAGASGLADRLDLALERWLAETALHVPAAESKVEKKMLEALRALGYIH